MQVTLGSTSSVGTGVPTFTLPVTAVSHVTSSSWGIARYANTITTYGDLGYNSTTTGRITSGEADTAYLQENQFTATAPGTWGTGSTITSNFFYQAA